MRNREAFEEWYSGTYRETIHILPSGQYASLRQQHSWDAWQARVPEGYVVVPMEPTPKMIDVGMGSFCFPLDNGRFSNHDLIFAYRAMIEAVEK